MLWKDDLTSAEQYHRQALRIYQASVPRTHPDYAQTLGSLGYATWAFSYTSKMPQNAGKRVAFEGVSQFELSGGKIKHYGEVFSSGAAFVQLGLEPARMEKVLKRQVDALRSRPRFARHFAG